MLYLWLGLVLVAAIADLTLSNLSGGRYTIGWHASRANFVVSSCLLLAFLLGDLATEERRITRPSLFAAYGGAVVTPYYDSMLVKVTAWAPTADEAVNRMDRALREFRIRGVSTNLQFLENVIGHAEFRAGTCITRFIDNTPELFRFTPRRDRATKLLRFIGEVIVNGNPEMKGRRIPDGEFSAPPLPVANIALPPPRGMRDELKARGAAGFAQWLKAEKKVLLTDTTMRDAHQSLFATRMRTADMAAIAPYYARLAPQLLSPECWGGATFDVALRFLKEDPWERLAVLRAAIPNIPFQMLLRSIDQKLLASALKGADAKLLDKIMRNLSQRSAEMLREEISARGPMRVTEIDAAKREVITIAQRLEREGTIILPTDANDLVS